MRRTTRKIKAGSVEIGGDAPVSVQGMTKVPTGDVLGILKEFRRMISSGAEIIRVAVLNPGDAETIPVLKKSFDVPVVADIHYLPELALLSMRKGADKIRINPYNMQKKYIRDIIKEAKISGIPIRIGINSGSVKIKGTLAGSLVHSALDTLKFFQDRDFHDIVLSLKTPDVRDTLETYRKISEACDYPLHLGITEAGRGLLAESKSILGIGALLLEGIGDTIRVSLTEPSSREIEMGKAILQSAGLRRFGPEIISCPTCGRTRVDIFSVLSMVEREIRKLGKRHPGIKKMKIAVMGCSVNGPGEAKQADIGIAGGEGKFALFKKGTIIGTYGQDEIVGKLIGEIKKTF
ncbi:MAG TPA: flavodoxin-dependent (E)-4-hydroxy-3-methylbut-2-enyl-diphosphate synthase [bacterium]|nr:flavodoxin-dependent (E)-4-hydroxy-3-methylbut-2-enyl-diphosphate synthase [bacterium]